MYRPPCAALFLALIAASCGKPAAPVSISFAPRTASQVIECGEPRFGLSLTDLRLYVHDIRLVTADGETEAVTLDANHWQQSDLALLDFEDGSGDCINGTADTNLSLRGTVPAGNYRGLQFVVGVPADRNHADPLAAVAPLGDAAMHWHWRAGYKFLRAGFRKGDDGFWIHLGSTGCEGTTGNISSCRYPNRVAVELADFVPGRDIVAIDLDALLIGTNLDDGLATDCSSGPPETACIAPFAALGINHDSGEVIHEQRLFLRRAVP